MLAPVIQQEEPHMLDFVFLGLGLAGFALLGAYAMLCDRM
jgi:hypothetical protein